MWYTIGRFEKCRTYALSSAMIIVMLSEAKHLVECRIVIR
jgi:hypothetical protein